MKILGREPALWLGLIGAAVAVLVAGHLPWLSAGQGTAVVVMATAVMMAATTRPVAPALFTGVLSAATALLSSYGLHVSDGMSAALAALVLSVCALMGVRPAVSPKDTAISDQ